MDLNFYILCLAVAVLVATSLIYGLKFLGKRNYLLGIEWLVVTFSGSNFLLYALGDAQLSYRISMFCDAFSRGFGIPVIAVAGLMAVTHRYRPAILVDVVFFMAAIAGTIVLVTADFAAQFKPYFYVAMWSAFSVYLAYFAWKLLNAGEGLHAFGVFMVLLTARPSPASTTSTGFQEITSTSSSTSSPVSRGRSCVSSCITPMARWSARRSTRHRWRPWRCSDEAGIFQRSPARGR